MNGCGRNNDTRIIPTRRTMLGGAAALAGLGGAGLGSAVIGSALIGSARAAAPPALPAEPVSLNVIDVAGQLQLTQRRDGGFRQGEPEAGVEDRLQPGAGAGTARAS